MLWSHKADLSGNYKTFLTYSHFSFHLTNIIKVYLAVSCQYGSGKMSARARTIMCGVDGKLDDGVADLRLRFSGG